MALDHEYGEKLVVKYKKRREKKLERRETDADYTCSLR
jgi:hypothetical protein